MLTIQPIPEDQATGKVKAIANALHVPYAPAVPAPAAK